MKYKKILRNNNDYMRDLFNIFQEDEIISRDSMIKAIEDESLVDLYFHGEIYEIDFDNFKRMTLKLLTEFENY